MRGTFKEAVTWVLSHPPGDFRGADGRFRLQGEHCELSNRLQEYTIIVKYNKSSYARDVGEVLDCFGLGKFNRGEDEYAFKSQTDSGREGDSLLRFYTESSARKLLKWFDSEYKLFHFAPPAWISHTTGDWYEKKAEPCKGGFPLRIPKSTFMKGPR